MASRVGGAVLALTAAALVAVSIATSAWWSGHPTVGGAIREKQDVYVGPLTAEMCNTGGDGACRDWPRELPFEIASFATLGTSAVLALGALLMIVLLVAGSDGRKAAAKLVIVFAVLSAGAAAAMVVIGPIGEETKSATIPLGYGLYLFWGGAGLSMIGAILALRPIPPRKIVLKSAPAPVAMAPGNMPVDLQALMQEDTLRPASLGPEPTMGRGRDSRPPPFAQAPVASPGGALPGPSGPLGAVSGGAGPLFSSAPHLRALYDANPQHGGTGGLVTQPAAPSAMPAPMIPRHQISSVAGIPTPPPVFGAPMPPPPEPSGLPRSPITAAGMPPPGVIGSVPGGKSPTMPPPMRGKPPSMSPPMPRASSEVIDPPPPVTPHRSSSPSVPPYRSSSPSVPPHRPSSPSVPPRSPSPSVPPRSSPSVPPAIRSASPSVPPHRPSPASVPPPIGRSTPMRSQPAFPAPPAGGSSPQPRKTIAVAAAVPAPSSPRAPIVPFPAKIPVRADTDPVELPDTIDAFDAKQTYARDKPASSAGLGGRLVSDPGTPDTDLAIGDSTSPNISAFEAPATAENPSFARPATSDDDAAVTKARDTVDPDDLETVAQDRVSAADLLASSAAPPAPAIAPAAPAPAPAPAAATPPPPAEPAAPPPASSAAPKLPISTAPESLPPPSERQSTSSGPSPACPQCEAPMAWVEAHLRFYCKSCKMYF